MTKADLFTNGGQVSCPDCCGVGEIECSCCDSWDECDNCNGFGVIDFSSLSDAEKDGYYPLKSEYFDAAIEDIKKLCEWCGKDFLVEVAPFIKKFRGYDDGE